MDAELENTAGVRTAARRQLRRSRSPFELWAWGEVSIIRIGLVLTYLANVYFAVVSFLAGVPVFELTTPQGYTAPWAACLAVASLVATFGALSDRWKSVERWSALVVSSLVFTYVAALTSVGFLDGDPDRQAVSAATMHMLILPLIRFAYLAAQTGKRRA